MLWEIHRCRGVRFSFRPASGKYNIFALHIGNRSNIPPPPPPFLLQPVKELVFSAMPRESLARATREIVFYTGWIVCLSSIITHATLTQRAFVRNPFSRPWLHLPRVHYNREIQRGLKKKWASSPPVIHMYLRILLLPVQYLNVATRSPSSAAVIWLLPAAVTAHNKERNGFSFHV